MESYTGQQIAGLWRIEWELRKSGQNKGKYLPHFHLLLFTVRYIPYLIVRQAWAASLSFPGYVRTEIKRLANEKQHGYYVAKYTAKLPPPGSLVCVASCRIDGKHWGYIRLKKIPRATKEVFLNVPWAVAEKMRAIAGRELPWYDPECDKGFCLFGRFGRQLGRGILKMLVDSEAVSE